MPSIFSRILAGEIPCHKVAETDKYLAFLDINPVATGHVLCIPKHEVDYIFDLDDEEYIGLMAFAKKVAKGLKEAVPCRKIGVTVLGLEVPHAHVHLVPMRTEADMDFHHKGNPSADELSATAKKIAACIRNGNEV